MPNIPTLSEAAAAAKEFLAAENVFNNFDGDWHSSEGNDIDLACENAFVNFCNVLGFSFAANPEDVANLIIGMYERQSE